MHRFKQTTHPLIQTKPSIDSESSTSVKHYNLFRSPILITVD